MREGEAGKSFVVCRENAVALGDDDTTTTLCDASLCLGLIFLSAVIIVLLLSRRLCEILFYTLRFPAEKLQP